MDVARRYHLSLCLYSNYAPGIMPQVAAGQKGYTQVANTVGVRVGSRSLACSCHHGAHRPSLSLTVCIQNLWLFGPDHHVTEVGTMNLFVHWVNEDGETELITPPLSRGDILPGITRDSILTLAREWGECSVAEKNVTMPQLQKAVEEGRVLEIFGSGTAAIVTPVSTINYLGKDLAIPLDGKDGKAGKMAERILKELTDIQVRGWCRVVSCGW